MASEIGDLYVVLRAVTDPFKTGLKEAAAEGEVSSGKIGGAFKKLGSIGVVAGGAALAIGAASVKWAADFQTQMTRLYTAAGLSNEQLKAVHMTSQQLNNAVLQLGTQVGYTGTQMAEALYHPISAGLDLKSALQVVKYAAEEAKISGASLDDTTYSLSSVMKAFNFSASQAGPTMASLNAIVGEGDMRFQDFNQSIKNWAPTAAQMGISVNSMGAGLAYLTDRGNSAEVAATRMTMGISMMTTPSKQAAKLLVGLGVASTDVKASTSAMTEVLKKTGITQNKLAQDLKQPDGLYVALTDLKDGLQKAGVSGTEADSVLAKIFGGGRSDKAIMSLMQNLGGLKTKFDAISHDSSMEHFQSAWQKTQQTFSAQLKQTEAALVNMGIKLGTVLLPYVQKFLGWVRTGVAWLAQHKGAVLALAGALATALVGAIIAVGGAMMTAMGPELAIAAGIMALGAAVVYAYNHFTLFRSIVNAVGSFLGGAFAVAWRAAGAVVHWFSTTVLPMVKAGINTLFSWFAGHKQTFVGAWQALGRAVQAVVRWLDANVLAWIRARIADLVAWWHAHSAEIVEVWRFAFGVMETIAKVWWDGVLRPMLSVLASVWRLTWGVVRDTVVLIWRIISSVVSTGIHLVLNTIGVVLDLLTGHWGKAWHDLVKLGSDALNDVVHAVTSIASGFGDLLYDAGANIIKGLISGIKSMISGAGNAIGDVVHEIKHFLPWSPAKKGPLSGSGSPEIGGRNIGKQLASGLYSAIPDVAAASSRLAGAAALAVGGASGSLAGLAAGTATGTYPPGAAVQVINLNIQGSVLSDRDLRDLVQQEMLRLGARNSMTWQPYKR